MICAACGATASDDARFCASCGRTLRAESDERRVVTVLFADLVGFTTLSERLDPERVKNLVDRCFDRLAVDVTSFGGQVDKIVGDALVALFGVPTAHEDDAERAVRAALRMQQTLCEEVEAIGAELQVRIGVNTGEVLVGAMRAAGSVTAMGDVVNTASRLQTAASPGEVLVGPATHAATSQTIAYEPRGLVAAKGRDEPVDAWVAVAPTLPPGYRARRVDVPLVGRDHELGLLQHAVGTSMTHERALLVLLVGDVGMGKSRLADEIAGWTVGAHRAIVREGRCVPYGEANVWWPVADALRDGLAVREGDGPVEARVAVREQVATAMRRSTTDPEVQRTAEGLLTLLGFDPPPGADATSVREEAGRALGAYATASAELRPLVLQLSDLHWADDAVLTLIDDVFGAIHHRPVVVLASARPALLDRWTPRPGRHNSLVLHLDPLGRDAADDLLERLVGSPLPEGMAEALFDRSGGNPFFLEELVSLLDGDAADGSGKVAALPATLRGLVAARLDDLPAHLRTVLQDASVIGQRGPIDGLREMEVRLGREVDVDEALAELAADEIMELERGRWAFRSDLVREVAYQTITKADRAKCHIGIALYLEERAAGQDTRPPWLVDQLAHHYGAAVALVGELGPTARTAAFPPDLADRARRWVVEAAAKARRDHALPTAIRLYGQAIDLLGPVDPPRPEGEPEGEAAEERAARAAEAIELHLGRAGVAAEAWDLPRARTHVEAACQLADDWHDPRAAARALVLRGDVEQKEGDIDRAMATLSLAADRFTELDDGAGLGNALRQRGMVEIFAGRTAEAEASAQAALDAFVGVGHRSGQGWATQNLAWTAFVTGRPAEADRRLQQAIDLFSDPLDTRGLSWSLGLLAWVRFQQHRVAEAKAIGEQVLEEARARTDPWATAMMQLLIASIGLWGGRTSEAVEQADQALRTFRNLGDPYGVGQASSVLGRALVMVGRVDEGFALLTRAGNPEGASQADSGPASGQVARFTRIASAIQVGEPDRASDDLVELARIESSFGGDPGVILALAALQAGDGVAAEGYLDRLPDLGDDANALAVRALCLVATGRPGAQELAALVADIEPATYLDRTLAELAAAFEAASPVGGSDGASEARRRLTTARALVAETEDQVATAVVELAGATLAHRLGDPDAATRAARADGLLANLGIEATGWTRIFSAALGAVPT